MPALFGMAVALLIGISSSASAQDLIQVRVSGRGLDREAALSDAFVQSARQAFGTFVLARAESRDALLSRNEVLTIGQGFVDSFEVLSEKAIDGTVLVDALVRFSRARVRQVAAEKGLPPWEDFLGQAQALQQAQDKIKAQANLVRSLVGDPYQFVRQAFSFELVGYEVTDVGPDYFAGNLVIQAVQNELFFHQFEQLLQALDLDSPNTVIEGLLRSPAEVLPHFTMFGREDPIPRDLAGEIPEGTKAFWPNHGFATSFTALAIVDGYRIHPSVAPLLPNRLFEVTLRIGSQEVHLGVFRNVLFLNQAELQGSYHLLCSQVRSKYSRLCKDTRGENLSKYSPSLADGGIYVDTDHRANPGLVVTKNFVRFKAPFRTRELGELEALLTSPVDLSVREGQSVEVKRFRYMNGREYFIPDS